MILSVNKLIKKYKDRVLFENFNFEFKDNKLYSIIGESGSGKSTLLNILSLNDSNYEGNILADEFCYEKLSENEKRDFKIRNFGYVFQNFNLFDNDTVYNNLRLTLDAIVKENSEVKERRINEVLSTLGLDRLKDQFIKNLSGGEKQRVALGRAIITSPQIIFCDEPTGSLDEENTKLIFELLKSISSSTTVIVVTHDHVNAKKYSDFVLTIDNKTISTICENSINNHEKLKMMKLSRKRKEGILSNKFIFYHFKNLFKIRKIRNLIRSALLSVSLISSGLAMSLTTSLNQGISSSFSSIVSGNEVVLTKKNVVNQLIDYYSSNNQTIQSLLANYSNDLNRYGVNYLVDFENYFIDGNELYSVNGNLKKKISGFTARHFNEFIFIDDYENYEIFPELTSPLKSDEIIISLTFDQMKEICLDLKILRDFESLGNYLKENNYYVSLELANYSWQYTDEQLFNVRGVIFDNKNRVYHTNNLFNENLFENQMRFPTSNNINKIEQYPWMFKKVYYLETAEYQSKFLNTIFYDSKYSNLIFDIDSEEYRPLTFGSEDTSYIYVYDAFKDDIDINIIKTLDDYGFEYENYYFSTPAGYFNSGTNIFTGFNNPTFFSLNVDKLNNIIDAYTRVNADQIYNIEVPDGVVDGFALKPNSDNVKFKVIKEPLKLNEIKISGGFAEILNEKDVKNKDIYITMLVKSELNGGMLDTTFNTVKVKINDVIEEDKSVSIYHNKDYSISLFRDLFRISSFRLIPNSIIFEMPNKVDRDELQKLNNMFDNYEFKNPLIEIEESIEESTYFLRYILYAFTIISLLSSLILSFIITFINASEQFNEIRLLQILGFRDKQITKMFFGDNLFNSILCVLTSFLALIFINILVGKALGNMIGLSSINIFTPLSIITIILVAIFIVLLSSLATKSIMKESSN